MAFLAPWQLSGIIFLNVVAAFVGASHFRAAQLSWIQTPRSSIQVTFTSTFRRDYFTNVATGDVLTQPEMATVCFDDGSSCSYGNATAVAVNVAENLLTATFISNKTVNSSTGNLTVYATNCCRLSNLVNAGDNSWRVAATVDLKNGANTGSPYAAVVPLLQFPESKISEHQLVVGDPDGDDVQCSLASFNDSFITDQALLSVSPACILTWNGTAAAAGQYYAAQVLLNEKRSGALTGVVAPVDFIIQMINVSAVPPTCSFPDELPSKCSNSSTGAVSCSVSVEETLNMDIQGNDPDGTGGVLTVVYQLPGLPGGVAVSPAAGSNVSSPGIINLTYTAPAGSEGSRGAVSVIFQKIHSAAVLTVTCSFTITVGLRPPAPPSPPLPLPPAAPLPSAPQPSSAESQTEPSSSINMHFVKFGLQGVLGGEQVQTGLLLPNRTMEWSPLARLKNNASMHLEFTVPTVPGFATKLIIQFVDYWTNPGDVKIQDQIMESDGHKLLLDLLHYPGGGMFQPDMERRRTLLSSDDVTGCVVLDKDGVVVMRWKNEVIFAWEDTTEVGIVDHSTSPLSQSSILDAGLGTVTLSLKAAAAAAEESIDTLRAPHLKKLLSYDPSSASVVAALVLIPALMFLTSVIWETRSSVHRCKANEQLEQSGSGNTQESQPIKGSDETAGGRLDHETNAKRTESSSSFKGGSQLGVIQPQCKWDSSEDQPCGMDDAAADHPMAEMVDDATSGNPSKAAMDAPLNRGSSGAVDHRSLTADAAELGSGYNYTGSQVRRPAEMMSSNPGVPEADADMSPAPEFGAHTVLMASSIVAPIIPLSAGLSDVNTSTPGPSASAAQPQSPQLAKVVFQPRGVAAASAPGFGTQPPFTASLASEPSAATASTPLITALAAATNRTEIHVATPLVQTSVSMPSAAGAQSQNAQPSLQASHSNAATAGAAVARVIHAVEVVPGYVYRPLADVPASAAWTHASEMSSVVGPDEKALAASHTGQEPMLSTWSTEGTAAGAAPSTAAGAAPSTAHTSSKLPAITTRTRVPATNKTQGSAAISATVSTSSPVQLAQTTSESPCVAASTAGTSVSGMLSVINFPPLVTANMNATSPSTIETSAAAATASGISKPVVLVGDEVAVGNRPGAGMAFMQEAAGASLVTVDRPPSVVKNSTQERQRDMELAKMVQSSRKL